MIKINEIFFSIQGESSYAGWPTVFIRTSGCPLRCTYCDTKYAYFEGQKITLEEIVSKVKAFPARFVCLTGGEPLAQPESIELLKSLCDLNYSVSVETSGSEPIKNIDGRVKKIIDVKTPDSGAADSFLYENIFYATPLDEFKFVICSEKDFHWAENFVKEHHLINKHLVLYSPSFENVNERWLAEMILKNNSPARLQLQLHKYIWSPDTRGV